MALRFCACSRVFTHGLARDLARRLMSPVAFRRGWPYVTFDRQRVVPRRALALVVRDFSSRVA